jgi:hypothetical protein
MRASPGIIQWRIAARAFLIVPVFLVSAVLLTAETLGDMPASQHESPIDVVRIRLLRYETRRWQIEAANRDTGQKGPRDADPDGARPEPAPIIPAEDSFDDWAFGGKDGEKRFRGQLDKLLQRKLHEVEQVFQLSQAQRRKLQLAGRGDIQRLLDMVEDARREFQLARSNLRRLTELQKDLRLVELRVSDGLFEIGSLFAKTLRKMNGEKQLIRRAANTTH